eukprot:73328_1
MSQHQSRHDLQAFINMKIMNKEIIKKRELKKYNTVPKGVGLKTLVTFGAHFWIKESQRTFKAMDFSTFEKTGISVRMVTVGDCEQWIRCMNKYKSFDQWTKDVKDTFGNEDIIKAELITEANNLFKFLKKFYVGIRRNNLRCTQCGEYPIENEMIKCSHTNCVGRKFHTICQGIHPQRVKYICKWQCGKHPLIMYQCPKHIGKCWKTPAGLKTHMINIPGHIGMDYWVLFGVKPQLREISKKPKIHITKIVSKPKQLLKKPKQLSGRRATMIKYGQKSSGTAAIINIAQKSSGRAANIPFEFTCRGHKPKTIITGYKYNKKQTLKQKRKNMKKKK